MLGKTTCRHGLGTEHSVGFTIKFSGVSGVSSTSMLETRGLKLTLLLSLFTRGQHQLIINKTKKTLSTNYLVQIFKGKFPKNPQVQN